MGILRRCGRLVGVVAAALAGATMVAACTSAEGGQGDAAAYRPPDVATAGAAPLLHAAGTAKVMALSPDGRTVAVLAQTPGKPPGLCLTTAEKAAEPATGRCLTEAGIGRPSNLVTFSPDGSHLLVVPSIQLMSTGPIYLVSVKTATAQAVPVPGGSTGSGWWFGTWNATTGDVVAMWRASGRTDPVQLGTIDPATGKVTPLGAAADSRVFPSGQPLASGSTVLYPLLSSGSADKPDLMVFDLATRRSRVIVDPRPAGAVRPGYQLLPLALAPDGSRAVVGVNSQINPENSSAQLLNLQSGSLIAVTGSVFPQGAAFSPDGSTVALLQATTRDTQLVLARSDGTSGRSVARVTNARIPGSVSMVWSRPNNVTVNSVGHPFPAAVAGWTLR